MEKYVQEFVDDSIYREKRHTMAVSEIHRDRAQVVSLINPGHTCGEVSIVPIRRNVVRQNYVQLPVFEPDWPGPAAGIFQNFTGALDKAKRNAALTEGADGFVPHVGAEVANLPGTAPRVFVGQAKNGHVYV